MAVKTSHHFSVISKSKCVINVLMTLARITAPLLKLPLTKLVIKVNIDLCNYNLPKRDEFVITVILIRVMIKFNKGVVIRPIDI
jgi:hypothetical protein